MEKDSKKSADSDASLPSSAVPEKSAVAAASYTYHLRDREMLRKRRAEAQEKDLIQRLLREQEKSKQPKRGRGARRGQGRQPAAKPSQVPELEPDPKPNPQEEAEPEPILAIQGLVSGMQLGAAAGEEKVLRPAKAETSEALNAPVEKNQKDNKHIAYVLP